MKCFDILNRHVIGGPARNKKQELPLKRLDWSVDDFIWNEFKLGNVV